MILAMHRSIHSPFQVVVGRVCQLGRSAISFKVVGQSSAAQENLYLQPPYLALQ